MKKSLFLAISCSVVWLVANMVLGLMYWRVHQDIVGWKTRAQVSSEPNDMLIYMTKVRDGMESWGMTTGSAALIFHTPANDMELIYKTVLNHVDQAHILTKMDRTTPEYQTGLDNLRGSIRELELYAYPYWTAHQGLILRLSAWISFILACVFWIWHVLTWD